MRPILAGLVALAVALPLASPAAAAGTVSISARSHHHHHYRHHYHHYGNSRAALRMFGMVAGTIAGIAAANEDRDDWHRGYGYYDYGYPPPYGYGPYYPY